MANIHTEHCSGEPRADGNGLGADGCVYPGDPDHCGICRLTAEKEVYQKALEKYAETCDWSYYSFETQSRKYIGRELASAALEQGKKIREGK
jgi:hypothetical protein